MDINCTLLGQMITFIVFVWFTMKYIWPPVLKALQEREQHIADGLAAAERGRQDLQLAQQEAIKQLHQAKLQSAEIMEYANKRANQIIEDAKELARQESERLLALARSDTQRALQEAKEALRVQAADLVVLGAGKVLGRSVNHLIQQDLVEKFIAEI